MENNRTSRSRKKPEKKGASNFIIQGTILAAAGIIVRLIGMLYRIPLANILGDEGNGYYSSAFTIYSILLIVLQPSNGCFEDDCDEECQERV